MSEKQITQGLQNNWQQFFLLVLVNAFVGGMVGLERSILPLVAAEEFGMVVKTAIFSFIVVFGISKALANFLMGKLADRFGRKQLLIVGWIFGLPVPFILMYAPDWSWIVFANVLLGINQGLAWSSTVVMKIDLVGEKDRGFAMGINEFAGYISVGLVAFLTTWIADEWGLRPYPFYLGIVLVVAGLAASIFFVKDTKSYLGSEQRQSDKKRLDRLFWQTSWLHPNLGSVSLAGLINNLNDGLVWGLLPILLLGKDFTLEQVGIVVGIYPIVWGVAQLVTGKMGDHYCKKDLLFYGMLIQSMAILAIYYFDSFGYCIFVSAALGIGTAMVYPTFLSTIADNVHPSQRAESIGIFRMWRDLGYAVGALLTGIVADLFGMEEAFLVIFLLTLISAITIQVRMFCTIEGRKRIFLRRKYLKLED